MARLNYNHLYYFWAVAHEGNLTRAAELLHVSQSAVSIQIRKLERELGQELFDRGGRQLVLTEAGRIALDHADEIFARGTELLGILRERGSPRRVLRVGAVATLSRNFQLAFLAPAIANPKVQLLLRSGALPDLLAELDGHRLDVVLTNAAPPPEAASSWIVHALASQPVSLVGPTGRFIPERPIEDLLANEPLILPGRHSSIRIGFDALIDRLGIEPRLAAEVDDMAMLRLLARAGMGLAVVPPIVVRDEIEQGVLSEISHLEGLEETFLAVSLPRRFPNPILDSLLRADRLATTPQPFATGG
ncbi:MAG: LysR family transcriptional regulator [Acidobacteria bacterium]|nr:LysR family transcriptional regulator [Acidobacteriota bacterium]